jgi:hydroxyethylthiazole kinase-like uncharacterized protein yjeF
MLKKILKNLNFPKFDSHKGENGKLLVIGGSELFHSASRWSLDVASCFVDMVIYASTEENTNLFKESKQNFGNGIVINFSQVENYISEVDCVLIGPGMMRGKFTTNLVNNLLTKYQEKKWVIDAGALQMLDLSLLNSNCIITPNYKEISQIFQKLGLEFKEENIFDKTVLQKIAANLNGATILIKGYRDVLLVDDQLMIIDGGNVGLTKGGTGDCLSGLLAGLFCKNDKKVASYLSSLVNKRAAMALAEEFGFYYNASLLVGQIPKTFHLLLKDNNLEKEFKTIEFEGISFLILNYQEMTEALFQLAKKINNSKTNFDRLVVLSKGGWVIARILIDFLSVENVSSLGLKTYVGINQQSENINLYQEIPNSLEGENILLVDDVADSGASLKHACDYLVSKKVKDIKTTTLFYKKRSVIKPDFFMFETRCWIVFPFEIGEMIENLIKSWETKNLGKVKIKNRLLKFDFPANIIDYFLEKN